MLTDVTGIRVGHWTDTEARTGCTVVVCPPGTVASGEVRGGAPATREFALLDPAATVAEVDAVVLSGGSAFGLAAGHGVVEWMEEHGRGFPTAAGPVPIVVGMSLFDLMVGDGSVRPGPAEGRAAAEAATDGSFATGAVGAGTGATVDKWGGPDRVRPGGIVTASIRVDGLVVACLVAVNAVGFIDDGASVADIGPIVGPDLDPGGPDGRANTTIGVVATNAVADKVLCHHLARSAHDGLARALLPAHTAADGDAFVALATGGAPAGVDDPSDPPGVIADPIHLRLLAQQVVTRAVRSLLPGATG